MATSCHCYLTTTDTANIYLTCDDHGWVENLGQAPSISEAAAVHAQHLWEHRR